ncbi:nucleoside hydrolase [Tautonia plasticadhaerens]|uniref:Inosine-uridine preferring nucleoside hydrolase n=1 Tax=Tautonia plasticadhaerens TaxID=2527974 RepID=A0A518GW94_9BACT|nr:nucleoside hydrolase [Tautonia plasticadhaerens]QDV32849.1 Inosine-uridine preferring nucleoside hydrolase [Tautonia plasticadhaerens]
MLTTLLPLILMTAPQTPADAGPVRLIFDTDLGNDVDDALALGLIHALQSRGKCELLAVTVTKDHELAAPLVDAINHFYGRGSIPIGVVRDGATPDQGKFLGLATEMGPGGGPRYPHDLRSGNDAPEAVTLLRRVLAGQPDGSVVIAQVGFSTNLARLIESAPDDASPLSGRELVSKKVRLLSIMAGAFAPVDGQERFGEYNVVEDLDAARSLVQGWPTPIVFSGFEVGNAITYPAASIERDFSYVDRHPIAEAYQGYEPTPHERPTWDLTSVLYGVEPDRGYFDLSPPGRVVVDDDGHTRHLADPEGPHRYLIASASQVVRVREAFAQLVSQPPDAREGR